MPLPPIVVFTPAQFMPPASVRTEAGPIVRPPAERVVNPLTLVFTPIVEAAAMLSAPPIVSGPTPVSVPPFSVTLPPMVLGSARLRLAPPLIVKLRTVLMPRML